MNQRMTSQFTSKLEAVSNVAVSVASIAFVVMLVHREWSGPEPKSAESLRGAEINLAMLTSSPSKRNVILFISETCQFCEQEMPFYRSLREKLSNRASLITVFPKGQPAPEAFLAARSIRVDDVESSNFLTSIGVTSTPTLLLVDESGRVMRAWVGAQSDAQHGEIVQSVVRDL